MNLTAGVARACEANRRARHMFRVTTRSKSTRQSSNTGTNRRRQ